MGTLREDMEAASTSLGETNDTGGANASADTGSDTGVEVEATPVQSVADAGEPRETSGTEAPPATGRARDASGKFTKGETSTTKASQEVTPAPSSTSTLPPKAGDDSSPTEVPKQGEADITRPPTSWKHAAWEDWGKAPESFRREIHRREAEMQRHMEAAGPMRQYAQSMKQATAPLEEAARARGTTVDRMVADYGRFDAALSSRDPAAQAAAVAQVIKAYGVDIEALAEAIDSKPRERPVDPREIEQRIRAQVQAEYQSKQSQAEMSQHVRQVQEFAKSPDADLFNDDIRFQMAALIDAANARGVVLSLKDAYTQAVWANPATRAIVQQRESAKARTTAQAATQKAMAAGGSIKSRPASPVSSGGGRSLREDLEAVAAEQSGR